MADAVAIVLIVASFAAIAWIAGWIEHRREIHRDGMEMIRDFREMFPGRCVVCSLHQYGLEHGYEVQREPEPHRCIKQLPLRGPDEDEAA